METGKQYPYQFSWARKPVRFILHTDDADVAARATEVFRYWDSPDAVVDHIVTTRNMTVARAGKYWNFTVAQSGESFRYNDIASVIRSAETEAALAVLEQHHQLLTVHGALMARGSDAVLIVGPSGAGKSTTSCAMWAAGWQLLADDVSIVDPPDATASPLMRRISLRHPSREILGNEFWQRITAATTADPTPEGYVFHPDELDGRSRNRQAQVAAILFLRRLGALNPGPAQVLPMPAAQALMALAPYTNVIRHTGMGEAINRLGPLVNRVPCYDLGRGPVDAMVQSIDDLLQLEVKIDSCR